MSVSKSISRSKSTSTDQSYIFLGSAYYVLLVTTVSYLLWDHFKYGNQRTSQTIERFRDATANVLFFLTVSGVALLTRYLYQNKSPQSWIIKAWWVLGFLYLIAGIYWGFYYYMFTDDSQPSTLQATFKWLAMIYFITISVIFTFNSCAKGCLKPFILPVRF